MRAQWRVQQGGDGESVLLLLHGLGATGDVWNRLHNVLRRRWPGRWVTPDLPGHGGSGPLPGYSFGHLAAAVARMVPSATRLVVLGHSLGGVVALALASGWFGVRVSAVGGLGIKVAWTEEELARAGALAAGRACHFAANTPGSATRSTHPPLDMRVVSSGICLARKASA